MKPCTNALYVSLISRCDSAAIVPNTSELFPDPETPVNTVSRRFGISTLMSLRLFTRAPCTRIMSWRSASRAGGWVLTFVALLIVSPFRPRIPLVAPSIGVPGTGSAAACRSHARPGPVLFSESGRRESNPHHQLGRLRFCP